MLARRKFFWRPGDIRLVHPAEDREDAPRRGPDGAPARGRRGRGQAGVQDRYVADVGGFGKYGLLRSLCAVEPTWGTGTFDKASSFTIPPPQPGAREPGAG